MLYILIKESYAMHSCLYNEYIIHILNAKGRKQKNCVPHQECWKSQEACCSCWSKQNTPLGTNSPCFLCFVPSFPLICLKVFTSCYRDKKNEHWVVTAGQHKMSRSRKTDMALTLVTDTENTLIITKTINKGTCVVGGFCNCDSTKVASFIN